MGDLPKNGERRITMHIVLAGDSIFDNGSYVPGGPALVDVLREALAESGKATLLAVDGSVSMMVPGQLGKIPKDADRLFISSGGNDALACRFVIDAPAGRAGSAEEDGTAEAEPLEELPLAAPGAAMVRNIFGMADRRTRLRARLAEIASEPDMLARLAALREEFRLQYRAVLEAAAGTGLPTCVCTIYDAMPGIPARHRTALALFNEVILAEAAARGLQILDLRLICTEAGDYSEVSPIEPSEAGSRKIVERVLRAARDPVVPGGPCRVYA